ncbi:hypothetical protein PA11803_01072 [Pseudomonas aeruginosa]|nr:hypothetical protein PA1088_02220 [Pseudomonas aeruginosa]AOX32586.1 hypothetical protein PA8281_06536 [Pseudomonas aeruginosa]AOX39206.1 hypothetical protein PA11803_01072 [Pseudomonas aeruginosa]APB56674.1 hypothetical protein PA7790_00010 [Pseudomonas aeruginosa]MCE7013616.1 hypothetical protein [Pseudomonas aeruginosa]
MIICLETADFLESLTELLRCQRSETVIRDARIGGQAGQDFSESGAVQIAVVYSGLSFTNSVD